jgi:tetratricopeptide (TPR) repeat protein
MMNLFFSKSGVLLLVLLLSACGSKEPAARSVRQEQAVEFNQRAQRAFLRGEYQAAVGLYESALQLDAAIENEEGIAVNLLNLARVNQTLGKSALAQQYLDRLLGEKALHFPATHLAAAATQYGLIRLQAGDVASAKTWLDKAAEYCASDCVSSGVIANLRANIAIQSNDKEQALAWSERAVSANKDGVQIEYANALRLSAQARLLREEFGAALPLLEQALGIDKTLGLPDKIRQDLVFLAQAQDKLGRSELAAQYRERAARIAAASVK